MKFGNLLGRAAAGDGQPRKRGGSDRPVIHQSVPDEVLFPEGRPDSIEDSAWLETVSIGEAGKPEAPVNGARPSKPPETNKAPTHTKSRPAPSPEIPNTRESTPNGEAAARPRNPVGWLVIVEGPGVGEWFVLEKGTSHIGSGEGQTARLNYGDRSISAARHAALIYDEQQHVFVLSGDQHAAVRLNGMELKERAILRDGDVFTLGGTSLRLFAVCSQNFNWD